MHKQPVGLRVSAQLHAMLTADTTAVTQGPSATGFTVTPMQAGEYKVQVAFEGGTGPLTLNGTRQATQILTSIAVSYETKFGTFD